MGVPEYNTGLWLFRNELIEVDGRLCRVFYHEDGTELKHIYAPHTQHETGITISRTDDPKGYVREYYRKVRSKKDGRTTRGYYKKG